MLERGIEPDEADVLLRSALENVKLSARVLSFYDAARQSEENELAEYEKLLQQSQAQRVAQYQQVITALANTTKSEKMPIHVPEAEQAPFQQFVQSLVFQAEDEKFYVGLPVDGENADKLLQSLYLLYAKGDVTKLKPREVRKQGPRLGVPKVKQPIVPPAQTQPPGPANKGVTIQDFFN